MFLLPVNTSTHTNLHTLICIHNYGASSVPNITVCTSFPTSAYHISLEKMIHFKYFILLPVITPMFIQGPEFKKYIFSNNEYPLLFYVLDNRSDCVGKLLISISTIAQLCNLICKHKYIGVLTYHYCFYKNSWQYQICNLCVQPSTLYIKINIMCIQ